MNRQEFNIRKAHQRLLMHKVADMAFSNVLKRVKEEYEQITGEKTSRFNPDVIDLFNTDLRDYAKNN